MTPAGDAVPLARPPDGGVDARAVARDPRSCSCSTRSAGRSGWASSAATPRARTARPTAGTSTSTSPAARSSSTPSGSRSSSPCITVPIGVALGVGLAVLADKYLRGIGVFRTIFSSTVATSVAVASLMWLFLLQPDVGVLANVELDRRPVPGGQVARAAARPGHGVAVGRGDEHLGQPRVHVHPHHRRAAGHPPRPPRGGGRRRRRRDPPVLERDAAAARADAAVRRHRADGPGVPGVRRDRPAHRWRARSRTTRRRR